MPESDVAAQSGSRAEWADDLALLRIAAKEAGHAAMRHFRRSPKVWMKNESSPVSEADIAANNVLRESLMGARPSYGWLSEESEDDLSRLARPATFVVDPIDGTRAFLDGADTWCVCAAVVADGQAVAGVLECPATGETFEAMAGGGAFLNGKPVSVAKPSGGYHLAGPKPLIEAAAPYLGGRVTRHPTVPSLAYRVAMVAAGRIDGTLIKPRARDWDIAAADILLAEAGGAIVTAAGERPLYARRETVHGTLVAAGRHVMADLLDAVRRAS